MPYHRIAASAIMQYLPSLAVRAIIEALPLFVGGGDEVAFAHGTGHDQVDRAPQECFQPFLKLEVARQPQPEVVPFGILNDKIDI